MSISSPVKASPNPEALQEKYLRQIRNAVVTIMIVFLLGCLGGVIAGIAIAASANQQATTTSCTLDNPAWPNC
jgi:hypothetical protein